MNKQELIERIDSKMFAYPSIEPETEDDTTVEFKKGFNCACENIKRLADQKLDEPEKVVVPKFVAKKLNHTVLRLKCWQMSILTNHLKKLTVMSWRVGSMEMLICFLMLGFAATKSRKSNCIGRSEVLQIILDATRKLLFLKRKKKRWKLLISLV